MTPTADRRYLLRLGMDVLQRSLSAREVAAYLDAPVDQVVSRVMDSPEAMQVWLEEELYYFLLLDNFRPEPELVDEIPRRLRRVEMTARDALGEIMLSTGFSLRNPGNDTFVTVVLEQCLGLEVQERRGARVLEAGKQMYDGRRVRLLGTYGQSQADIIKIVLADSECTRFLLDRHHRRLLGEPLPESERAEQWVARIHEQPGGFFALLREWILSDPYRQALAVPRPRNDRQFVRALYLDLLDRRPSYEELRNMRNAMQSMADPAPLRAVMAKLILDSPGARLPEMQRGDEVAFVRQCFLGYLAREPGDQELQGFVETLLQGGTPRQVVRTLVGSPEYQYY